MSNIQWSQEQIRLFLETLQAETIIWDPNDKCHKDKKKINDAWLRIRDIFEGSMTVEELKKKKDSLFATYRGYCRKIQASVKSGAGVDDVYRPVWFAFDLMDSFLGSVFKCKQTMSTYFQNSSYSSQVHMTDMNDSQNVSTQPERQFSNRRKVKAVTKTETNNTEYLYNKKQMEDTVVYNKNESHFKRDMDEYDLYGQLLATKLRKLDERQRDYAMHEIDNIMFKAKIQCDPIPTKSYPSSPSPGPRKIKSPVFIITAQTNNVQYEDENMSYSEQPLS